MQWNQIKDHAVGMLLGANSEFKLRLNSVVTRLCVRLASPAQGGLSGYLDLAAPCHQGSRCFLCVLAGFPAVSLSPGERWSQKFQTSWPPPVPCTRNEYLPV